MRRIIFFCSMLISATYCTEATTSKARLMKTLFKDYDKELRPVLNSVDTINVGIRFGIIQLLNVADKSKSVQTVCYMAIIWRDQILNWNPVEYDNITEIRYSHSSIWMPDIILANTPDLNDGPITVRASTNVAIDYKGTVKNAFTAVFTATCGSMDSSKFPFDEHRCYFDFTSWTYNNAYLDLYDDTASRIIGFRKKYIKNSEWDMEMTGSEKLLDTECCPNESFPILRFHVRLRRKPLYYLVNIVIPTCITCYIAFVGMFSPSTNTGERTEKAFLGITTLLAVSMLMLSVSAQMPVTSAAVPLMGYFLGTYVVTIALAIICTAIIMHIDVHGLKGRPLPPWARVWFLERLGVLLRVCEQLSKDDKLSKKETLSSNWKTTTRVKTANEVDQNRNHADMISTIETTLNNHFDVFQETLLHVKKDKEEIRKNREDWAKLSQVLDRICLIGFVVWSTLFTIIVMSG